MKKKNRTVCLKIKSCEKCPHVYIDRDYTEDSFETCFKWDCTLKSKNIARYVDWNEKDPPEIPKWCPLDKK